ncbi:hypothetical protein NDU88_003054 [Pleurodeles waltl]|uniref:Uncharacterized protein n=1 Tax=Pleurodeles waltl TaxID=8319 RepID=A0AAV7NNN0_PLEWA|nr:hypothetical protein NDU88_003054 [Pleurodeles waltl]
MRRGSPEPIQLLFVRIYCRFGWQAPNAEQCAAPSLRARSPTRQAPGWPAQRQGCRSRSGRLCPAKVSTDHQSRAAIVRSFTAPKTLVEHGKKEDRLPQQAQALAS